MRARRLGVVVVAACVMVGGLTGLPAVGADEDQEFSIPKSAPNKNTGKGATSEAGVALAKARKSQKRAEIVSRRTSSDTTWANPDGSLTRDSSVAPVRARNAEGDWAPIDTTLSVRGERIAPKNTTGDVSFSGTGAGDLATFDLSEDTSVGLSFDGELGEPSVKDSMVTYPVAATPETPATSPTPSVATAPAQEEQTTAPPTEATPAPADLDGVAVKAYSYADGFATHLELSKAPAESVEYRFALTTKGLTPTLVNGALELTNAKGTVVARSKPFHMWDSRTDGAGDPSNTEDVAAELIKTDDGHDLVLSPSQKFLTDPTTKYPVTVDPDISSVPREGDTWYFEGQSSSNTKADDYRLIAGSYDGSRKMRALFHLLLQVVDRHERHQGDLADQGVPQRSGGVRAQADPGVPDEK